MWKPKSHAVHYPHLFSWLASWNQWGGPSFVGLENCDSVTRNQSLQRDMNFVGISAEMSQWWKRAIQTMAINTRCCIMNQCCNERRVTTLFLSSGWCEVNLEGFSMSAEVAPNVTETTQPAPTRLQHRLVHGEVKILWKRKGSGPLQGIQRSAVKVSPQRAQQGAHSHCKVPQRPLQIPQLGANPSRWWDSTRRAPEQRVELGQVCTEHPVFCGRQGIPVLHVSTKTSNCSTEVDHLSLKFRDSTGQRDHVAAVRIQKGWNKKIEPELEPGEKSKWTSASKSTYKFK